MDPTQDPTPLLQDNEIEVLPTNNGRIHTATQINASLISNKDILQIVKLIGGIHVILDHGTGSCLNNPFNLSSNQLTEIHHILHSYHSKNSDFCPVYKTESEATVFNLDINNNYLYQLCGFGRSKIVKFLTSITYKIVSIILLLSIYIYLLLYGDDTLIIHRILPFIPLCLLVPMPFIGLMSINKTVILKVVKSFTFWFKLLYWIMFIVCSVVLQHNMHLTYWTALFIVECLIFTFVFLTYLFIDGYYVKAKHKKCKRYSFIFAACSIASMGIWLSFVDVTWNDPMRTIYVFQKYKVDLISLMAGSIRVLSLFMMKQSICVVWKPQKAALIRNDVIINWILTPK